MGHDGVAQRRALEESGGTPVSTNVLARGWTREAVIVMFEDILSELGAGVASMRHCSVYT